MIKVRESWRNIYPGAVLGRLTVLGHQFRALIGCKVRWVCVVRCECGTVSVWQVYNLNTGHSCGCINRANTTTRNTKHGEGRRGKHSSLFERWRSMKGRCANLNDKDYGGRGISVCQEWAESFEAFRSWANANGYAENLEIDRIENNGNYEPGNCRWITRKKNSRNRRNKRTIAAFGEVKTLVEWTEDKRCSAGIKELWARLNRGWDAERAISTPVKA